VESLAVALLGRTSLEAALRLIRRQVVRHFLLGVIDAARDDRLIWIAAEEFDDDLLADPRNVDPTPALAGPNLCDPQPAGAVFVLLAQAVPEELHLYAAI